MERRDMERWELHQALKRLTEAAAAQAQTTGQESIRLRLARRAAEALLAPAPTGGTEPDIP
jgi:hypothetical protein